MKELVNSNVKDRDQYRRRMVNSPKKRVYIHVRAMTGEYHPRAYAMSIEELIDAADADIPDQSHAVVQSAAYREFFSAGGERALTRALQNKWVRNFLVTVTPKGGSGWMQLLSDSVFPACALVLTSMFGRLPDGL